MKGLWVTVILLCSGGLMLAWPAKADASGDCGCAAVAGSVATAPATGWRSYSSPPNGEAMRRPGRRPMTGSGFSDATRKVRGQY